MTDLPLSGDVAVELSSGIAGGYCTKFLADAGAEVIKIEAPDGDPLRRWSASGTVIPPGEDGALFQFLACSKRSVVADPEQPDDVAFARELVGGADAVVWSAGGPVADDESFSPVALRTLAPHATVVAITPWGLDGPWAGRAATEFTLQAWAGGMGVRGPADRPPISAGGRTGEWAAGVVAAAALLASRQRTLHTGVGELVDVSILEALVFTHGAFGVTWNSIAGSPLRPRRSVPVPLIERTKDGWVGFAIVTGQQWLDFCAMVERPDWAEDPSLIILANRLDRRAELNEHLSRWLTERTTAEIVDLASLFRIPVTPIGNGATLPEFDHVVERGCYVPNPGAGFLQPRVPYRFHDGPPPHPFVPAPRLGADGARYRAAPTRRARPAPPGRDPTRSLPFSGMRVAEFGANWAGPIVGQFLAVLGAEVVHVESASRPDPIRFQSVVPMADAQWWWWEFTPYFHVANTNKLDLTIDMQSERGREVARRLLERCDVVIDSYSPRVMSHWGLDYASVRSLRPDVIMLRAPAFGLTGPWRDRPGYAMTMEQVSGMAWLAGHPDGEPQTLNGPMDPLSAVHAIVALLLALEHRRRTGQGMLVEASMLDAGLNVTAEQVIEHSAYGRLLERTGNRGPAAAPQGLYLSADVDVSGNRDRWVAIAVEYDEQWDALRRALGDPGWAQAGALATPTGRREAHDDIDRGLSEWCAGRTSDEIVETLASAGVPVGTVLLGHEQDGIPHLEARGYYEPVEHPIVGTHPHARFPARFSAGPLRHHRHGPPLLGEHDRRILSQILHLSDEEIHALEAEGVTRHRPGPVG